MIKVPSMIPVAVLQAVRAADRPAAGVDADLFEQFAGLSKLGQSGTVAAQIDRYRALRGKSAHIEPAEVAALIALFSRRGDADWLFAEAGRRVGRHAARTAAPWWGALRVVPVGALRRTVRHRMAVHVAQRALDVDIDSGGRVTWADRARLGDGEVHRRVCDLYRAATAEVLRTFTPFEGALFRISCRGHGDPHCVWSGTPTDEESSDDAGRR